MVKGCYKMCYIKEGVVYGRAKNCSYAQTHPDTHAHTRAVAHKPINYNSPNTYKFLNPERYTHINLLIVTHTQAHIYPLSQCT